MPFHVKRTNNAHQDVLYQMNGIRSTRWVKPEEGKSVTEIHTIHTPTALLKIPKEKNYLSPPYHWHWYQAEHFIIREGRFIFTLEGKEMVVSPTSPQPIHIPVKARHTFRVDETHEGPCTLEVTVDAMPGEEDRGMSEKFFRSLYTYLDDCYMQDVSPSVPQLLLMMDSVEGSMAFSWGPDWLMQAVTYAMGVVVGRWFGGYVLGYKASYPEYWDEARDSRKAK